MTLTLPSRRDEAWRWADLDALAVARTAPHSRSADAAEHLLDLDGPRLVFVDGSLDAGASTLGSVAVEPIVPLCDHPLGKHAAGTGWSLTLAPQQVATCVQIIHIGTGGESHIPGRIVMGVDAVASVIETYVGTGWANRLTTFDLAEGARLMRSVRILQDAGFVSLREEATISKAASFVSVFLGAGGMSSRVDGTLRVIGDGGYAEMGGALLTRGDQRQECAVTVRHEALNGSSNQLWRAVAADRSAASLAARVDVARGAQKTDGVQSLRGLILDRTATVNLKPELEIFADDVKCAHGATVGELDRAAMFYLQSRGIGEARAKALMTRAFVADAIDRIGEDAVREAFAADADAWLEGPS